MTSRAKRAFELALLEARSLRHLKVEPEHLLLGLMREKEGLAAGVLYSLGIPFRAAQEQIQQLALSRYPVQSLPPGKGCLAQLISDFWRKRA